MANRTIPSQEYLRECFVYDTETGVLIWRVRPREHFLTIRAWRTWNARFAGKPAGGVSDTLHIKVCIDNVPLLAHRVIFKLMTGKDPDGEMDHINGVRGDNRWINLREATHQENQCNKKMQSNNASGFKGIYWQKTARLWRTMIMANGKYTHIGYFRTAEAAHQAYCEAAKKLHGKFWSAG